MGLPLAPHRAEQGRVRIGGHGLGSVDNSALETTFGSHADPRQAMTTMAPATQAASCRGGESLATHAASSGSIAAESLAAQGAASSSAAPPRRRILRARRSQGPPPAQAEGDEEVDVELLLCDM